MKRFLIVTALAAIVVGTVGAAVAQSRNCNTTCYGNGQYRTCNTHCY